MIYAPVPLGLYSCGGNKELDFNSSAQESKWPWPEICERAYYLDYLLSGFFANASSQLKRMRLSNHTVDGYSVAGDVLLPQAVGVSSVRLGPRT